MHYLIYLILHFLFGLAISCACWHCFSVPFKESKSVAVWQGFVYWMVFCDHFSGCLVFVRRMDWLIDAALCILYFSRQGLHACSVRIMDIQL